MFVPLAPAEVVVPLGFADPNWSLSVRILMFSEVAAPSFLSIIDLLASLVEIVIDEAVRRHSDADQLC
ncbi:MAG TPA: hypothetical protein VMW57_05680 [Methyloceanibacter sp.]|nr:hypothetical protein [Methyloceanibacter sp.]